MTREEFQERHGIVGQSVQVQELVEVIQQVAPTDITVLITGESGVGKEVFAKAIHAASRRSQKPMITVNCGAIPEGIIESELFGHEKGAFTGANETRKGYFELADGGTIFLDEIGELPVGTQVKFLRVLENGEFMRVGSAVPRKVDVRVIAATNKNLEAEVRHGNFRPDLFYRLRSINLHIPPLRERRDDIPAFVELFIKEITERNSIKAPGISPEAMALLQQYRWEGNVRELRNVIESLLVLERGSVVRVEGIRKYLKDSSHLGQRNLPVYLHKTAEQAERELIYHALLDMKNDIVQIKNYLAQSEVLDHGDLSAEREYRKSKPVHVDRDSLYGESAYSPVDEEESHNEENDVVSLSEMERRMITNALKKFRGNRRLAASALNISERTLYRKIKEYGLNGK
jgi:DNA-binding NtrC family response regulator